MPKQKRDADPTGLKELTRVGKVRQKHSALGPGATGVLFVGVAQCVVLHPLHKAPVFVWLGAKERSPGQSCRFGGCQRR